MNNLNFTKLSDKEMQESNGGVPWVAVAALTLAVLNTDWGYAASEFNRGYNS